MKIAQYLTVAVVLAVVGCQQPLPEPEAPTKPIFFPKGNKARLQFLKSFGRAKTKSRSFESFVLGEDTTKVKRIQKPFSARIYEGKIYVCDVSIDKIQVFDLASETITIFPDDDQKFQFCSLHDIFLK